MADNSRNDSGFRAQVIETSIPMPGGGDPIGRAEIDLTQRNDAASNSVAPQGSTVDQVMANR
jgi:hypothetical protein